jgi:hypothetical protein
VKIESIFFLLFTIAFQNSYANSYVVSNCNSSGNGSILWALSQTQAHIGPDTVLFNIPKTDAKYNGKYWEIFILQPLPFITDDKTVVDGVSQSKNQGDTNENGLEIQLNGRECSSIVPAIKINSSNNSIQNLAITAFPGPGINIHGPKAQYNFVIGCHIGNDANGIQQIANAGTGIAITNGANNNFIGGSSKSERNIISGNLNYGINIEESSYNILINNYIGVDVTGNNPLPNGSYPKKYAGVNIISESKHNKIGNGTSAGRNIISGNHRTGLRIENTGADSNIVQGNYFGLGSDGITRIPNGEAGLVIGRGARDNIIGGDRIEQGNVVSGNHSSGIQLARASTGNILKGNLIGTSASGIFTVPNDHNGVYFYGNDEEGYPSLNTIGPNNVICGNGTELLDEYWAGISLDNSGTCFNTINGNFIGINPYTNLQSGQPTGVLIQRGAHHNTIGPDNIIANSYFNGVLVMHVNTISNKITQNLIYKNNGKAIENMDGGNKDLTPPTILTASLTQIYGFGPASSTIELYSSQTGQAEKYIGTVQSDNKGYFLWNQRIPIISIVALAIDPENNTSELSSSSSVPVEFASFSVKKISSKEARLTWCTAGETNNLGFDIETCYKDEIFRAIVFIPGYGTTNATHCYEYMDTMNDCIHNTYRLKQIDQDGTYSYSPVISIDVENLIESVTIFPNPFNHSTTFIFSKSPKLGDTIVIHDILGRCIRTFEITVAYQTNQEFEWDGCDNAGLSVPSGEYFITLKNENHFITQKCLLLR